MYLRRQQLPVELLRLDLAGELSLPRLSVWK